MKKILAIFVLAGVSAAFCGCSQKPEDPGKKHTVAKPDLGEPGGAGDMHDESKGKSTITKPAPTTADGKQPTSTPKPAADDKKAATKPAPPADKAAKTDTKPAPPADNAKKADAKKSGLIDDKTDDKEEEEQK